MPLGGERLTRAEMLQLADHYGNERGVNYRVFCYDVDDCELRPLINPHMTFEECCETVLRELPRLMKKCLL